MKIRKLYALTASTLLATIPTMANADDADLSTALKDALTKYCVPPVGFYCNTNEVATYNKTTGECDCNVGGNTWIPEQRKCIVSVECPTGYLRKVYTGQSCENGLPLVTEEYTLKDNGIKTWTPSTPDPGQDPYYICVPCSAGTYLEDNECKKCPAGTYSEVVGATTSSVCKYCPAGTYSETIGASSSAFCVGCTGEGFYCTGGQRKPCSKIYFHKSDARESSGYLEYGDSRWGDWISGCSNWPWCTERNTYFDLNGRKNVEYKFDNEKSVIPHCDPATGSQWIEFR